jgi:RHS repeat-associated protein
VRGISEKFAVNPANGTANLSLPLPMSEGRDGFTPRLTLSYDSGAGNGPFGLGWALDVASISRRTDKGLPLYRDEEESDIFVLAGAEDLVPVLDEQGERVHQPRTVHTVEYEVFPYRPRIEGLYARIERWVAHETGASHWRTITSDNVTTLFGFDEGSTVVEGDDPRRAFSYLACRRFDGRGHLAVYTYVGEDGGGVDLTSAHEANRPQADRTRQRYLKSVRYGNLEPWFADWSATGPAPALPGDDGWHFELVLDYGEHAADAPKPDDAGERAPRPDPFSNHRAGFEVRTYRRCLRALMFHHFEDEPEVGRDCLVKALELSYSDQGEHPDPTSPVYTMLTAARTLGYRRDDGGYRATAMPPLDFEYSKPEIDPRVRELDSLSLRNLPEGLDGSRYRWVDLDSEGLPGILSEDPDAWRYKPNLSPLAEVPDSDDEAGRTVARFGSEEEVASLPSAHELGGADAVQLLDVSGGGRLDAVKLGGGDSGYFARTVDGGWEPLRPFSSLPAIDWRDPHLRSVDLSGDGRADALLGDDEAWTFYPSLGEEGFGAAERVPAPWEESRGGRPLAADAREAVHVADLTGDGLGDLVRIRDGEVCYWPNLGYGHFGPRVTMDGSPRFGEEDGFDPRRIRLADVDGSGSTDLLYVGADGVRVCFNRSGNSWSEPRQIAVFPMADQLSSVQAVDLLGNGTACLVWSSPLPGAATAPLRYVDLMSGRKPHLLVSTRNNLGAETRLSYAPSTRFYLEDREAGRPWATRLPFPVQVVERVEEYDWIGRGRFVSRYAYHHGFYDGVEREFRGFGMVEEWDTEDHRADTAFPAAENWDAASWSPPVHTKTWFHTGAFLEAGALARQFAKEYWAEPALAGEAHAAEREAMLLPDAAIEPGIPVTELREAHRALKGRMLRSETYAEDGSSRAAVPYSVNEQSYAVRRLQPLAGNRHAVFTTHLRESVAFHYERAVEDPRVTHEVTLAVDRFDNPLRSLAIAYPRRSGHPEPEPDLAPAFRQMLAYDQGRLHLVGTEHGYTEPLDGADVHRVPQPCETITAELTGLEPASATPGLTNLFAFAELEAAWAEVWDEAHDVPFEEPPPADVDATGAPVAAKTRRVFEHSRTLYRRDDLSELLPLGETGALALAGDSYRLAFTPGLLTRVLGSRAGPPELEEGGHVQLAGHSGWWLPSERVHYSAEDGDPPAVELAAARAHFFRLRRTVDTFGAVRHTDWDDYDLLPSRGVDAVGNVHAAANEYRVLEPWQVTDPNGNRAEVAFDCLGHVVGSAVMGKEGEDLGDSLAGFEPDLDEGTVAAHLADPLADPLAILGEASARLVYDLDAYLRSRDQPQPEPPVVYTLERESHVSELGKGETTRCRHAFVYSDGSGHEVQHKTQAEPGPLGDGGGPSGPRWVGSGWTINDNKGRPVRRYEPFFTATHDFEFSQQVGASTVTLYDPLGRVAAVLQPDDSWSKTVHEPWRQESWDRNDTTLIADPRTDPDAGDRFRRVLGSGAGAFTSWHDKRIGGNFGASAAEREAQRDAAEKAAAHAGTPAADHSDPHGHACLAVTDLGAGGRQAARHVFDAAGEPLATIDPLERRAVEYLVREPAEGGAVRYVGGRDLAGREIFHNRMDGGERRMLLDAAGHPIRSWDARGHTVRMRYDSLRRPTHRYVSTNGGPEALVSRTVYGEGMADRNLGAEIFRHYDESGVSGNDRCDFKGNLIDRSRRFAREYRETVDWSPLADATDPAILDAAAEPLLEEGEPFVARALHDALNRPVQVTTPHTPQMRPSVIRATYNEAGLVERVDVWERRASAPDGYLDPETADIQAVTNIDYDAQGRRVRVEHGNGAVVESAYDPLSARMVRLTTSRPSSFAVDERTVQDLSYAYDPVGNVTRVRDDADIHDVVFFHNRRVEPSSDYTYDAAYRLLRASGREHLGQTGGSLSPPRQVANDDPSRIGLPQPGDGNAMGTYVESYDYDAIGNLLTVLHQVDSGAWTRRYAYEEPSHVDPAQGSNRLSATSLPGDPVAGPYSAHYEYDAHGNATRMPHLQAIAWDEQDRLRSTTRQVVNAGTPETTYCTYDAAGHRLRKVTDRQGAEGPGTRRKERIYLGAVELYREYGGDGETVTLARETLLISAARRPVAVLETRTEGNDPGPPRALRYQYVNQIGTTTLELDDAAAIVTYEECFPYGSTSYQAVRSATETPKRMRFAGKERDSESGFYYSGARFYAPWLGRWFNPDPEGLADGLNAYQFVHSNPIAVVDPTGTAGLVIVGGIILTEEAIKWLGVGVIVVGGTGILASDPNVRRGVRERLSPHEFSSEPWPVPVPAPPVPIPVPPPPAPPPVAPPRPQPAPPPVAPPIPIPVPPVPVPIPIPIPKPKPIPIPIPVPPPRAGPEKSRERKREPRREPRPRPEDPPPVPEPRPRRRRKRPPLRYVTYRKVNRRTGRVYVGRTMGYGDPRAIVAARDRNHHMTERGYGPAVLDRYTDATRPYSQRRLDPSYQAIRGREQQLIDSYGGARSDNPKTRSGNAIRGVAKDNPRGRLYHNAASATFGQRHRYSGY